MHAIEWPIVVIGAAVVMAILNFAKDVLMLRIPFNRHLVNRWLRYVRAENSPHIELSDYENAYRQLIDLAAAGNSSSLLRLPVNQLAGQINAAAESVLDFPARHPALFFAMTIGADKDDVDMLLNLREGFRYAYMTAPETSAAPPAAASKARGLTRPDLMDIRARVTSRIQRRIDDLQIRGRTTWRLWMQFGALICALVLMPFLNTSDPISYIGTVVAAGFLAPLLHDVLSKITGRAGSI